VAALLCGCASAGHSFNNSAVDKLDLGQLQSTDWRSVFGDKPEVTSLSTTADGRFETVRFYYAQVDIVATFRSRILILEFKNGKLNGFIYVSSFDEHQPEIPSDKLTQISVNVSKKTDVLNILGKPGGKAFCPTKLVDFKDNCDKCVETWKWTSISRVSGFAPPDAREPSVNSISVGFDKDGVVSEVGTDSLNIH